jgi:hypothetical protein
MYMASNREKTEINSEIRNLLNIDDKLLGVIYRLQEQGITNATELALKAGAANRGVVYNNLNILKAILDRKLPSGASISLHSVRAIDRLMNQTEVSDGLKIYFEDLKRTLRENSEKLSAVNHDKEILKKSTNELSAKASKFANAIYVYSFPTYLHFGTIEDPDLVWLKIGSTRNSVWHRIVEQNRQTSMPEDPVLLRIYHRDDVDVSEYERKLHETLEKVGHERSAATRSKAGKEWFATTLDALDALAQLMSLKIESEIEFS